MGTTSACAENTWEFRPARADSGNYLRVRGEYCGVFFLLLYWVELPPRARRIPNGFGIIGIVLGTTSACAENTCGAPYTPALNRNYLRVRGEYSSPKYHWYCKLELPPRARRIPLQNQRRILKVGTTSACAENTFVQFLHGQFRRNYLRVRGEYSNHVFTDTNPTELPPRARRIR